jgi:hypothetical protein
VVVSSRCDAARTGNDSTVPASFAQRCHSTPTAKAAAAG